ncbi:MAG TPA: polysaccharide biosynthesis/export family protein [Gemmatimonadales bacterium]|jgi:hypothetical protein|nr:polysaccharide biosynthesis/export family protein [Gemmatimonadales bacterium]
MDLFLRRRRWFPVAFAFAVCMSVRTAAAQQPAAGTALATRATLRDELARLEARGDRDRSAVALIRSRLESGDFQSGDRIFIRVEGEPQLTDTFAVNPAGELELPQLGTVPLHGVLRSELGERLQLHLARFLRNPVVQVRPLIRLLIEGDVVRPGFYAAAPQQPLADVITQAGGLTQRAKPLAMRVERGGELIWSGEPLRQALGLGYSLDQLNLRAGDRVLVPQRRDSDRTWRILGLLLSLPVAAYTISQIH